jgi:hypothetical protein
MTRTTAQPRFFRSSLAWLGLAAVFVAGRLPAAPEGVTSAPAETFAPKPTAPIAIEHRLAAEPALLEPLELVIVVTAKADLRNGIVHLSADEGLSILSPSTDVWLPNLTRETSHEIPVTVLPLIDQRLYLHIAVSGSIGARYQGRATSIPIRVGPVKSTAAQGELKTDGDGQQLRALPAEESVR